MDRYEALKHAVKAHAGQVDKCSQPYILHPIAVAEALDAESGYLAYAAGSVAVEQAVIVALLHDVWEDTNYNAHNGNLSRAEQAALERLTRATNQSYSDYIDRIAWDPVACFVKLADLWHNLLPERQAWLSKPARKSREARYLKARDRIWEALGYEWWPEGGEG